MSDYISREALIKAVEGNPYVTDSVKSYVRCTARSIPADDVRPVVRGKWIEHGRDRPPTCSNCGSGCLLNYESDYHKSDYCPHCGADMRQTGDENV